MSDEGTSGSVGASATLACGVMLPVIALEQALATGAEGSLSAFPGNNLMSGIALGEMALMGISQLVGHGLGWAINRLLGMFNLSVPFLGEILSIGIFAALHFIRIYGRTPSEWAHWYFTNLLDRASDGGPRLSADQCPARGEPPPEYRLPDGALPCLAALAAAAPTVERDEARAYDVTQCFPGLLRRFQPIEYRYPDDLPAITIEELLQHGRVLHDGEETLARSEPTTDAAGLAAISAAYRSILPTSEPSEGGIQYVLAVDDDYARGRVPAGCPETVYGRVLWTSGTFNVVQPPTYPGAAESAKVTLLTLEYAHLRAGDWLPTRYLYDSAFQHDGDGESAFVMICVNLTTGRAWVAGTNTGGHDNGRSCPDERDMYRLEPPTTIPVEIDRSSGEPRPVIYIAHGSHAIAPEPGMRSAGALTTDWFPPRLPAFRHDSIALVESNELVRATFFTEKVIWGAASGSYKGKKHWDPPDAAVCNCAGGAASAGGGGHA